MIAIYLDGMFREAEVLPNHTIPNEKVLIIKAGDEAFETLEDLQYHLLNRTSLAIGTRRINAKSIRLDTSSRTIINGS